MYTHVDTERHIHAYACTHTHTHTHTSTHAHISVHKESSGSFNYNTTITGIVCYISGTLSATVESPTREIVPVTVEKTMNGMQTTISFIPRIPGM